MRVNNWRLSHEIATFFAPIPPTQDVATDFRRWRDDRLMAHYRPVRPWCSLILNEQTPLSILGEWHGASLLFPMEKVFERYVETCLRRMLPADALLTPSASTEHLCSHQGQPWFLMKPDFLAQRGHQRVVLDTKWKRLDASLDSSRDKYGLAQSDFYQLFAYGQRYLRGQGTMLLVYPKTAAFPAPLREFAFDGQLRLQVVPFDLESGCLTVDELPWDADIAPQAA